MLFQSAHSVIILSSIHLLSKSDLREETCPVAIKFVVYNFYHNILHPKMLFFHYFTVFYLTIIQAAFTRLEYTDIFSLSPNVIA